MPHRRRHRFKFRSLYVWHRYVGVTAAALVIALALTGIPLNHTERLALDSRFVQNTWLLDWYGIVAPKDYSAFTTAFGSVALLDSQLYVAKTAIAGEYHQLQGAIGVHDMLAVAVASELLLFTPESELIERLTTIDGLPAEIRRLGLTVDGQLAVDAASGVFQADADLLRWRAWRGDVNVITWSEPAQLPEAERHSLAQQYRARILPYERVLLDMHSGRILGQYGHWVMDAAALLMLFLAGSGVFIWLKRKR